VFSSEESFSKFVEGKTCKTEKKPSLYHNNKKIKKKNFNTPPLFFAKKAIPSLPPPHFPLPLLS